MAAEPPILRFTLRVLESLDPVDLARVCAQDMVELFGALRAQVTCEGQVIAEAGVEGAGGVELSFALSAPSEPRAQLTVVVARGPDLMIVRQQLLDLVAVVRRAYAHALVLHRESRRAREDALTGLENRRGVEEHLDHLCQQAVHTGEALTVMLVDLDHFKQVNDRHGHAAGDDVLQLAAEHFRAHLRAEDRLCRWGGDEFLLILRGLSAPAAVSVAERLRAAFAGSERARGATMTIGIADVASVANVVIDAAHLLERADACLYAAKEAGRNCTCVAPPVRRNAA